MVNFEQCENMTDEELVKQTLADKEYFLCLMKRYEKKLMNYIMRITNVSFEEAEDILQETFIKVYLNLNEFNIDLKFSSWVYRITHNQVISNHRKNLARPSLLILDDDNNFLNNIASDLNLSDKVDSSILKDRIKEVLAKLDEKYREVLVLKFLEEKDYKEISDILAKPMGTVATLINRAKKQFKEELVKNNFKI
jgi:RNA polymerase sigma-70 factor, ECF subfamily